MGYKTCVRDRVAGGFEVGSIYIYMYVYTLVYVHSCIYVDLYHWQWYDDFLVHVSFIGIWYILWIWTFSISVWSKGRSYISVASHFDMQRFSLSSWLSGLMSDWVCRRMFGKGCSRRWSGLALYVCYSSRCCCCSQNPKQLCAYILVCRRASRIEGCNSEVLRLTFDMFSHQDCRMSEPCAEMVSLGTLL